MHLRGPFSWILPYATPKLRVLEAANLRRPRLLPRTHEILLLLQEGVNYPRGIETRLDLKSTTVTKQFNLLRKLGYVKRCPRHGIRQTYMVTAQGRAALARAWHNLGVYAERCIQLQVRIARAQRREYDGTKN